jgi:hypothetical protein
VSGWVFDTLASLVRALEEYAELNGYAKVSKLGESVQGGGQSDGQASKLDCIMQQNTAINRAMARLAHIHPASHRLLHGYYRLGLADEAGGWERACLMAGMPSYRRGRFHEATFDWLLDQAHKSLYTCHRMTLATAVRSAQSVSASRASSQMSPVAGRKVPTGGHGTDSTERGE